MYLHIYIIYIQYTEREREHGLESFHAFYFLGYIIYLGALEIKIYIVT